MDDDEDRRLIASICNFGLEKLALLSIQTGGRLDIGNVAEDEFANWCDENDIDLRPGGFMSPTPEQAFQMKMRRL
ncbi:hypothetical protein [Methylobacterium sp. P5_C11]